MLPGARRDEIAGWYGDAIKIRCQAPALDGRANDAVTELLAGALRLKRSDVTLLHGLRSRDKVVEVRGLTEEELYARLGVASPASRR